MKSRIAFALAFVLTLVACATEPEKPAPPPAPVAKPAPPPPPVAAPAPPPQAPKPAPAAKPEAPKKPAVVTASSTELFEFDKATLAKEARAKLDKEIVERMRDFGSVDLVFIEGHADRLGTPEHNQRLSEKRAEAVRAYLVSKGFDAAKVQALGSGATKPVKSCPEQTNRAALIECLAPNRRVAVEVKGTPR